MMQGQQNIKFTPFITSAASHCRTEHIPALLLYIINNYARLGKFFYVIQALPYWTVTLMQMSFVCITFNQKFVTASCPSLVQVFLAFNKKPTLTIHMEETVFILRIFKTYFMVANIALDIKYGLLTMNNLRFALFTNHEGP
jgi:hypothetical protein